MHVFGGNWRKPMQTHRKSPGDESPWDSNHGPSSSLSCLYLHSECFSSLIFCSYKSKYQISASLLTVEVLLYLKLWAFLLFLLCIGCFFNTNLTQPWHCSAGFPEPSPHIRFLLQLLSLAFVCLKKQSLRSPNSRYSTSISSHNAAAVKITSHL